MNLHTLGVGHLPYADLGAGLRTPFGTVIPTGANVHYYRTSGQQDFDPPEIAARGIHTTLNSAAGQCRSGRGDVIVALPGSAENISAADQVSNLVASTKIVALGDGDERASLTWTAAGSTFLLDVANVTLDNLVLNFDPGTGTTTVAAPITVSAAGCTILRCRIRNGTDANSLVTIGITTTAAATRFRFLGNRVRGAAAAVSTTFLRLVGLDDCEVAYNDIRCASSSAAIGVIQALTTAPTNLDVHHNYIENNKTDSTAALTFMANATGRSAYNDLRIYGTGTAYVTTPGSVAFYETRGVNAIADGTAEKPTADFGTASA